MAIIKNELFGIEVEVDEFKKENEVKTENSKSNGKIQITDKVIFEIGDEAEIKAFLKKVIDTDDYNEDMVIILNEWIGRRIDIGNGNRVEDLLFSLRYKKNFLDDKYNIIANNVRICTYTTSINYKEDTDCLFVTKVNDGMEIRRVDGKIPENALFQKVKIEQILGGLRFIILPNEDDIANIYSEFKNGVRLEFTLKEDVTKFLNDLYEIVEVVVEARKDKANIFGDFFG